MHVYVHCTLWQSKSKFTAHLLHAPKMSQNSTQVYSGVFGNKMDINIIDLGEVFWNRQVFAWTLLLRLIESTLQHS